MADQQIYDSNGKPTGKSILNSYIGDPFVLYGTFNLAGSPYTSNPRPSAISSSRTACLAESSQVQFDNVFVDWGDGSVYPLSPPPGNANMTNWDRSQPLSLPEDKTSPYSVKHTYQSTGSYTVRVFQLSEADLQHVSASSVAASVDGPTTPFMQTALLSKMSTQGAAKGGTSRWPACSPTFSRFFLRAAAAPRRKWRATLTWSIASVQNITVPEDLAADGPLHLMGIADPDFGAYDISTPKIIGNGLNRISLDNQAGQDKEAAKSEKINLSPAAKTPEEPAKRALVPLAPSSPQPVAICSTCDDGMDATTYLKYYGRGQVRVTWIVDGAQSQQSMAIGPSQKRMNLTRQGFTTIQILGTVIPDPHSRASHHYFEEQPHLFARVAGAAGRQSQRDGRGRCDAAADVAQSFHRREQGAGFADADWTVARRGRKRQQRQQAAGRAQCCGSAIAVEYSGGACGQQSAAAESRPSFTFQAKLRRTGRGAICEWSVAASRLATY